MKNITAFILGLSLVLGSSAASAKQSGYFDFNVYPYDTRDVGVYTINAGVKINPRLDYMSFVNFQSQFNTDNEDLSGFYMEQALNWKFSRKLPFQLVTQWATASGLKNDVLRFALGWKVTETQALKQFFRSVGFTYAINYFPIQIDAFSGYRWQLEHYYFLKLFPNTFKNKVYLSGFFDHFFFNGNTTTFMEHQIGIQLVKQVYGVIEYRFDGRSVKKEGVGFGLEYKVSF